MIIIKKRYSKLNIYYKLLPYFFLYLIICIIFNKGGIFSDEVRYVQYAHNIINGSFTKQYAYINLCSGPGYPLFLVPFIILKFPYIILKLLNVFLLYFSLVITYKTFGFYANEKNSFLFTALLGIYYPIFEMLPLLFTECLAWFFVTLICYLFIKTFLQEKILKKYIILTSLSIAYLAMIKAIFGYVITVMLIISIIMFILPKFRSKAKKPALIFLLSFVFCLPWLFYTYSITKEPFLWAWAGSNALYTMSTPYPGELGDWENDKVLLSNPHHRAFMESIANLSIGEKDKAYQKKAIENIVNHPIKYLYNWTANVGRIIFSYPHSDQKQSMVTYFTIIPNMFIVVLITLTLPVCIAEYKKFPDELVLLFLFILIYFFGSTLVSGFRRIFYLAIPFCFLFFSFVFNNIILIKVRN